MSLLLALRASASVTSLLLALRASASVTSLLLAFVAIAVFCSVSVALISTISPLISSIAAARVASAVPPASIASFSCINSTSTRLLGCGKSDRRPSIALRISSTRDVVVCSVVVSVLVVVSSLVTFSSSSGIIVTVLLKISSENILLPLPF